MKGDAIRDYSVMREVLAVVAEHGDRTVYGSFADVRPNDDVPGELERLIADGLVSGEVMRDRDGLFFGLSADGLTAEGVEFYRLIENHDVWRIIHSTLKKAGIDVSYPLLKEVCEEIVKRYVTSFIPEI